MAYGSFENLDVWQKACKVAVSVYAALQDCRDYGLRDQMTKASVSIASNIAEGAERGSEADFIRFLHIAKGSAAELRTQVYIAYRIKIINEKMKNELVSELITLSKMIHSLIKALKPKT